MGTSATAGLCCPLVPETSSVFNGGGLLNGIDVIRERVSRHRLSDLQLERRKVFGGGEPLHVQRLVRYGEYVHLSLQSSVTSDSLPRLRWGRKFPGAGAGARQESGPTDRKNVEGGMPRKRFS